MSSNGSAGGKTMLPFITPATPALVQPFSIIFATFALVKGLYMLKVSSMIFGCIFFIGLM